jgi:hypothetical protein
MTSYKALTMPSIRLEVLPQPLAQHIPVFMLMTGTKFGQGTRGITKIREGDYFGATNAAEIFFLQNRQKSVRHVIHENN